MKPRPRFVTIFPYTENVHLIKDVGQIPYFMYKAHDYDSEIVTYRNNQVYPFLNKEVKGLKLNFIRNRGRVLYCELSILKYLISNSRSIDVLNLIHFKKDNFLYLLIFKFLNPKGKSFIKLDIDFFFFKKYNSFLFSNFSLKNYLLQILTRWIFKLTDFITVETEDALEYIQNVYPNFGNKLICIPNGVDDLYLDQYVSLKSFEEKENIIITVGRIGTHQKNTELLLEALSRTDLSGWKVFILGPIETFFQKDIERFFREFPHLSGRIFFKGNIEERLELFEWYNRAKIFCLTSRFEGFGIVFPEALYFGNYIISTHVSGADFITANGEYGQVVDGGAMEFSRAIESAIDPGFLNDEKINKIRAYSREKFTWSAIIQKLVTNLKRDA